MAPKQQPQARQTAPAQNTADLSVCIVGANPIGVALMVAARESGILRVALWERDYEAARAKSLVRVCKRWGVPFYMKNAPTSGTGIHVETELCACGPFDFTVICDHCKRPPLKKGEERPRGGLKDFSPQDVMNDRYLLGERIGDKSSPFWGTIILPRLATSKLSLIKHPYRGSLKSTFDHILDAVTTIKSIPGIRTPDDGHSFDLREFTEPDDNNNDAEEEDQTA
jgi:hypothetical protein